MIRNILRFIVVLGLVCLLTGGGVAILYAIFKGDLERRENEAREAAVRAVSPAGTMVNLQDPVAGKPFAPDAVYVARDTRGKPAAYIAGGQATGYSSLVKVMVSVRLADLAVERIVVVDQKETPGLGTRVAETRSTQTLWQKLFGAEQPEELFNPFLDQFVGKKPAEFINVHAITAATITSNAAKAAAAQAVERIRKALEGTGKP
jgi:RnfABCDGE-type electron transport complex G subunit